MPGRAVTVELTDDQAALLDEIAARQGADPAALLLEAVAHGLAMIVAGIEDDDLHDATRDPPPGTFPEPFPPLPKKRRRRSPRGEWESAGSNPADDDIPF